MIMQYLAKVARKESSNGGRKVASISAPAILGRPAYTCKSVAQWTWRCNPNAVQFHLAAIPLQTQTTTNEPAQTNRSESITAPSSPSSSSLPLQILSSCHNIEMATQCDFTTEPQDPKAMAEELSRKNEEMAAKEALTADLKLKTIALAKAEKLSNELQQQLEMDQLEQRLLQARMTALLMEKENYAHQIKTVIEKTEQDLREEFDREMDQLQKCNTQREHHLLEDCEWKIREVEKKYKAKVKNEKEMQQELIRATAQNLEWKFDGDRREWQIERDAQEKKIQTLRDELLLHKQLSETELKQVRGLSHELQKGIKVASEQMDEMHSTEKQLKEDLADTTQQLKEAQSLVSKLQDEICTMKEEHEKKLVRHFNRNKREVANVKSEAEAYWKQNLMNEISRLQGELCREYEDEKQYALEFLQSKKDHEITQMIADFHTKQQDYQNKIHSLKMAVDELESQRDKTHKNLLESDKQNLQLKSELLEQEERFHHQLLLLKAQSTRTVTTEDSLAELTEKQIQLDKRLRQMELDHSQRTFDDFKTADQPSAIKQQEKLATLNEMNETHETLLTALYHRLAQKKDKSPQQQIVPQDDFYWQMKTTARCSWFAVPMLVILASMTVAFIFTCLLLAAVLPALLPYFLL